MLVTSILDDGHIVFMLLLFVIDTKLKKEVVGDETGDKLSVTKIYRLQHPSPTSIKSQMAKNFRIDNIVQWKEKWFKKKVFLFEQSFWRTLIFKAPHT